MRIRYEHGWTPNPTTLNIIRRADAICAEYQQQGYDLTLRQLYYQFVARGLLVNSQKSYKRLGDIVNKARLAGLLDWTYIVDRTRNLRGTSHWGRPADIISSAAHSFRLDKWANQPRRVELWIEKDALGGVIQRVADSHDVNWFSCRGYTSQSEVWGAAQRHLRYIEAGQGVVILHLGDHDPSGIDMTRDIRDRLEGFLDADYLARHADVFPGEQVRVADIRTLMRAQCGGHDAIEVRRIALNYDQVQEYDPPPNPAKLTDSRANGYIAEHGYESWELDALDPATLDALITSHVEAIRDPDLYAELEQAEANHRALLREASDRWHEVADLLNDGTR